MTKRARIRCLMRKHGIERIVYCGPIMIYGSEKWNKNHIDCDFIFQNDPDKEPMSLREFLDSELKRDMRSIEKLCYYLFDFNKGEIEI